MMQPISLKIDSIYYEMQLSLPQLACHIFKRQLVEGTLKRVRVPTLSATSLPAAIQAIKHKGYEHLTLRISQKDYERHMSSLTSLLGKPIVNMSKYTFSRSDYRHLRPIKSLCHVRRFQSKDLEPILELASSSFHFTRFFLDDFFPDDQCQTFYRTLVRTYCDKNPHHHMYIGEIDNKVIGFLGCRYWEEQHNNISIRCIGKGLGGVAKNYPGTYPSILQKTILDFTGYADVGEYDAQDNNHKVIRVYQLFNMKQIDVNSIFHLNLQA